MAIVFKSSTVLGDDNDMLPILLIAPIGIAENDLLIASISVNFGQPSGITAPAGWIEIFQSADTNDTGNENRLAVFYKIATVADESAVNYAFSWTDGVAASCGGIVLYSGVSTTDPIESFGFATGDSTSPTSPAIVTSRSNTMVVRTYGCDAGIGSRMPDPVSGTYPAGTNGRFAIETILLDEVAVALADLAQPSSGSTGTAAFTIDIADTWVAGTVALNDESVSSSSSSHSSSSSSTSSSSSSSSSHSSSSSSASSSSSSQSSSSSSRSSSSSSSSHSSSSSSRSSSSSSSGSSSSSSRSSSSSSSDLFIPAPSQIPRIIKGVL